jgi:hypothetical protein
VSVTGAEETTSESATGETAQEEPGEGNAGGPDGGFGEREDTGGSIANTVLVFLSGMLAMLVIGLAVALYVVRRRGGRVA